MDMINICTVIVDRANYGRLKPVLQELDMRAEVNLEIICSGTMLLDRFGKAKNILIQDGFAITDEVYMELEGSVPSTMAKSIGLGILEFSTAFQRLKPDFLLLIGDRYEALSAVIAAAYQNICVIHIQGGEVSGSIDESARHAITKFAHYHFPATTRAGEYIRAMGEDPATIFPFGCPSVDIVHNTNETLTNDLMNQLGVGCDIDLKEPFLLVVFHPVTSEFESSENQMVELLTALGIFNIQVVMLWPNSDAGSEKVSSAIRRYREFHQDSKLRVYKNFEPEQFIELLKKCSCAIGNSSSFVRDASFIGVPIVLVGSRQDGRERTIHVIRVEPVADQISEAIAIQLNKGRYEPSDLYGSPGTSKRIVDKVIELKKYSQKRLHYSF